MCDSQPISASAEIIKNNFIYVLNGIAHALKKQENIGRELSISMLEMLSVHGYPVRGRTVRYMATVNPVRRLE